MSNPAIYGTINDSFLEVVENNLDKRRFAFYGGAGSGKSVFIAQFICLKLLQGKNERILVLRKWLPALKISAYQLILDILEDWGAMKHVTLNKSDLFITYGTNRILFTGLDNPEKIKSAEFSYIWIEEATDLNREDYLQLGLRLGRSRANSYAKMIFSFNPIDQYHWLIQDVVEKPEESTVIHHSTYLDNYKNLSQSFINDLEHLIDIDENYHRVYALGLPGVLKNIIYTNYVIENFEMPLHGRFYGLDFGFNKPMALLEIVMRDGEPLMRERYYEREKTTKDLINWMDQNGISKRDPIYADSAEPDRIKEIKTAGYNIHPARKDVTAGIDLVKSLKMHIHASSTNLISEVRTYKYRETKDGQVLEEPVPFMDHLMDCARYALFTTALKNRVIKKEKIPKGKSVIKSGGFT